MAHSLTKIWIHGIFHTNDNFIIPDNHEKELLTHIKNQMENTLNCGVRIIGSGFDHLHILFLLNPNISIKDVFQKIKGESTHWYNQTYNDGIKFPGKRVMGHSQSVKLTLIIWNYIYEIKGAS